jgi:Domain of unknown function (DUF4340)
VKRRALTNGVLLLVAAGLAAFIASMPEKEARPHLEPLSHENPRSVSHVRLELGEDRTIELRRDDRSWRLVEPIRIAANDFRVNALLRVLEAPVHARIEARAGELGRFGLAHPRARVLLDGTEILFGDIEPINGRRYLLFNGKVALVDDRYFSHLSSSAANYVDPALLGDEPILRRITLPEFSIYRDAGSWHVDPDDGSMSADDLSSLVDAWRSAQATAVRALEPSLPWHDEILIDLDDGSVHFDVARTEYELILGRADLAIQYHLTKGTGARLLGEQ